MTATSRLATSLAALACAVAGLGACGGTNAHRVVVRVGHLSISQATLAYWMSVLARRHVASGTPHDRDRNLKRQALDFLISTDWLIGEAADQGTPISGHEIDERLRDQVNAPAGASDMKLEIARELAATKIRRRLEATVPKVTAAEIYRYYKPRAGQFGHRERRLFYIEEGLTSRGAALARRREFELGKASIAKAGATLYEARERPTDMRRAGALIKAIFSGRRGAVLGPILGNLGDKGYYLMQITRILPPHVASLAEVEDTIRGGLESARWQQALDRFAKALRSRWIVRTGCSPGFVVQQCRQYSGPIVTEELLAIR